MTIANRLFSVLSVSLIVVSLLWPSESIANIRSNDSATSRFFSSELAAVVDAVERYNPISVKEDKEYLGAIFQHKVNGLTYYSYSVAAGKSGEDTVTAAIRIPPGSKMVAFWHTHGAEHWSREYFSEVDTNLVRQWDIPMYLASANNELHVFQPSARTMPSMVARNLGLGRRNGIAKGEIVSADILSRA